jgi:hypothetical protein
MISPSIGGLIGFIILLNISELFFLLGKNIRKYSFIKIIVFVYL